MSSPVTIAHTARMLGVTHRAARMDIDKLVEAGILAEVRNRARNKLFIAESVLRAAEGLPAAKSPVVIESEVPGAPRE